MKTRSQIVRGEDFSTPNFAKLAAEMGEPMRVHRKLWEFVTIGQVFEDRAPLFAKALGFGVGKEPVATWLAKLGAEVVATDRPDATAEWSSTGQWAEGLESVFSPQVGYPFSAFERYATYRAVDMRALPLDLLKGEFDFTWSCGSFEHIGGIEAGLQFFTKQMHALKPGGWAAHTTEFNIGQLPLDSPNLCLFSHENLLDLQQRLADQGDRLLELDLTNGTTKADTHVDVPPYGLPHLKLELTPFRTTSIILIAQRGAL